jgi:hypothetical protein
MLNTLKQNIETGTLPQKQLAKGYLSVLYQMIGHTRDIIDGKGEYTLSYMMIYTWNKFYPQLAEFVLKCFVDISNNKNIHPYGSWKDIKYFCQYCRDQGETIKFSLIQYAIKLINKQIQIDFINNKLTTNGTLLSLAAKWAPREKSKFGWLYEDLATNYFSHYVATAKNDISVRRSILKCKTDYRYLLSMLNRQIDTLQIKQCENIWENIDFDKVTSISLLKQKKAFLNIDKTGNIRQSLHYKNNDRICCSENFNMYIQKAVKGEVEMKGKRIGMSDFTKQALSLLYNGSQAEKELLNYQWRNNSSQNNSLGKMIAMVDVSGTMSGDPLYAAIAIGIRIAEKSLFGKRIMTFSSKPEWINLDSCNNFISQVEVISKAPCGMNTNFHAALDIILNAIIENKMTPEDVQDMVLVILSDMQMDFGNCSNKTFVYEIMKNKYEVAGIRVHGTPYKPPHILFWNLRSTTGFPSLSNQSNVSMMSGFSPSLLNLFCEQGVESLQSCTPWSLLIKSLKNERYKIMADKFEEVLLFN